MIQDGQQYLLTAPWMMIMPGLAILSTVLAFTLLGDGLRDALDVKMKDKDEEEQELCGPEGPAGSRGPASARGR